MAYEAKTKSRPFRQEDWLATVDPARRDEARQLLALFSGVTGWEPRAWGTAIVGFGRYAYRYDTGHSGEWAATGFAARKADLVIYIMPGYADFSPILSRLGPHRIGKSCLYIRRLDRTDKTALADLIRAGLAGLEMLWPVHPA
jgi:hypothetical protein